jgi:hypothetical protein
MQILAGFERELSSFAPTSLNSAPTRAIDIATLTAPLSQGKSDSPQAQAAQNAAVRTELNFIEV